MIPNIDDRPFYLLDFSLGGAGGEADGSWPLYNVRMNWELEKQLKAFAETVSLNRGRAYVVGGAVRDGLLGLESEDIDVEVHGIDAAALRRIVASHFKDVNEEGKTFGVLRAIVGQGEVDISLPRTDSKVAPGHKGFEVHTDPFMGIEAAAERRDFTINAMLQDVLTGEVHDPYGGRLDLESGVLRAVNMDLFGDDPLRILRAVQLVARFNLTVESRTMDLMRRMVPTLSELSADRKREEWKKLFLKASKPSRGLQLALDLGLFHEPALRIFERMAETKQDPIWHPEGSVWKHTLWGCDEAAKTADRENLLHDDRLTVMLGELLHDTGKPDTTRLGDDAHVHSKGHSEVGVVFVRPCLTSMGLDRFSDAVERMVLHHHAPMKWAARGGKEDALIIKLARELKPTPLRLLCYVTEADLRSRGPYAYPTPKEHRLPDMAERCLARAVELGVADRAPENVINGNELIKYGFTPGPIFGMIVRAANMLHDEDGLDKKTILARIAAMPEIAILGNTEEMVKKLRGK